MKQESRTELVRLTVEAPSMPPPMFEDLAGELRPLGFEAIQTSGIERRSQPLVWEIALRVWHEIDQPTIGALMAVFVGWLRRVRRERRASGSVTVKLYGPDGDVLREVPVD